MTPGEMVTTALVAIAALGVLLIAIRVAGATRRTARYDPSYDAIDRGDEWLTGGRREDGES